MSHRLRKQFFYGLFFFSFWAILTLGIWFFFFRHVPSCFDKIQNQKEEGIDCGLVCSNVCIPSDLSRITQVGDITVFQIDSSHVSVFMKLKNGNDLWAARRFQYTFELFDAAGVLLKTIEKTDTIYGLELKDILIPNIDLGQPGSVASVKFTVHDPEWILTNDYKKPELQPQDQKLVVGADRVSIEGRLLNRDTIGFSRVTMIGVFFNQSGRMIGASQTVVNYIGPQETQDFSINHPPLGDLNTGRYELYVTAER